MIRLIRFAKLMWFWRWPCALAALLGGVRLHPSAILFGSRRQLRLGRGTTIGARSRLELGRSGRVVTGEDVWLSSEVEIQTDTEVCIGLATTVQRRSTINGSVRIGRGCIFSPNVFVSSGTHPFREIPHLPIREQELHIEKNGRALDRPVWIQGDCWLGVNSVVCPGVTVGKGSVVGANAVVTRNVPPYSVVAGSPARIVGQRMEWRPKTFIDAGSPTDAPYVLSGRFPNSNLGSAAAILVTGSEPLCVALTLMNRAAPAVRLKYSAASATTVLICGHRYRLEGKYSELLLPQIELTVADDGVYLFNLAIVDDNEAGVIEVHRVEVVGGN
jgi:acetyltransferase-like isoleucine patch superfamily enzyme